MKPPTVFFDTNVLVEVVLQRGAWHRNSAFLWTRVEERETRGVVSAITFNNMYYVLRKYIGREGALLAVARAARDFEVVPQDREIIAAALASDLSDFEDAIQFVSAQRSGADYLVTRNVRDFPRGVLEIVLPEDLLERLNLF